VTVVPTSLNGPLGPVRDALRAEAENEATAKLAAAEAAAAAAKDRATAQCERISREARIEGEADGQRVLAAERARFGREARATVLRAETTAYDALRAEIREAVTEMKNDPAYPVIVERLTATARELLGAEADVVECAEGGVVATSGGKRLALTLPVLADEAVSTMFPHLERLWSR
jgi:vacuolar-type H+-ATPase subunit E/Vma4